MSEGKPEVVTKITVDLLFPVEYAKEARKITSITLRELTVDEIIEVERDSDGRSMTADDKTLFAKMSGLPPEIIGALKSRDWRRLKNKYHSTLGNVGPESDSSES